MSSDETDREQGLRVYRIKKKFWRAPELGLFLRTIDRVAEQNKNATSSRGSLRLHRIPGGDESHGGRIVPELPVNFYDPTWLANFRAATKPAYDSLKINPNVYPLVHDLIIQQWVSLRLPWR